MDTLVWTITHSGLVARVGEDGSVDGDPALVAILTERLAEPVTVYRSGTVRTGARDGEPIELRPGDGRYVVARIRTLCDAGSDFEIVDCDWR